MIITLTQENPQLMDVPELIPARMLNEFAYCPRLAYLEWVQGEFADNLDTLEGRFGHRRVDEPSRADVPEPENQDDGGQDEWRSPILHEAAGGRGRRTSSYPLAHAFRSE